MPVNARDKTENGPGPWPWSPAFASMADERDYLVEDVEGRVPAGLRGVLFRNGPGRNGLGEEWFPHWFDGDGMVSAIAFTDQGIRYRNRFVRTESFQAESASGVIMRRGFGKMRPGGVLANSFRLPANVANTSVVHHADRLFALWEGGPPTEIDPATLDTLGLATFDGRVDAYCAHPRLDPATGELFGFGIDYGSRTTLTPYRIDASGRLGRFDPIRLPWPVMNHDFVLTGKYLVFILGPVVLDLWCMLFGFKSFADALRWDPGRPTLVLLVSRQGGAVHRFEANPCFQFHFAGGFDDGEGVVLDAARYNDFLTIGQALRNYRRSSWPARGMAAMTRLTLDPHTGRIDRQAFQCGNANEFPRIDPRRSASRHRYIYMLSNPMLVTQGLQQLVTRLDTQSGAAVSHDFGPKGYPGEPVFIPRPGGTEEDDGYVVTLVFDTASARTEVVGLDARELSGPPLFRARLTHHVPLGLHGCFTPERVAKE